MLKEIDSISLIIPKPDPETTKYDELVERYLVKKVLKGDKTPLEGIGRAGRNMIFLISRGVILDPDALAFRYLDSLEVQEVWEDIQGDQEIF